MGKVSLEWCLALKYLVWPANTAFIPYFVLDATGKEVAECRNKCVELALTNTSITHLLWIDDDVIYSKNALNRLLSHNTDVVSGVYFMKHEYGEPIIFPGPSEGTLPYIPGKVYKDIWGHGLGLCLVKSDVYRKMAEQLPLGVDKYGITAWHKGFVDHGVTKDDIDVVNSGAAEDLYFLDEAHKLGIKSIVDCHKDAFGWHQDRITGITYPMEQWKQNMAGQPITWNTPEGVMTW